jgi:hypothetical protein
MAEHYVEITTTDGRSYTGELSSERVAKARAEEAARQTSGFVSVGATWVRADLIAAIEVWEEDEDAA